MSQHTGTPPPPPPLPPAIGPGSPQDVPPPPGSFPVDPATLPGPIRDEILAPDPVAIDTASEALKDGQSPCPKGGATAIRPRPGTGTLICLNCRDAGDGEGREQ